MVNTLRRCFLRLRGRVLARLGHFGILDFKNGGTTLLGNKVTYEGWNFNSGNYLFTTDTK